MSALERMSWVPIVGGVAVAWLIMCATGTRWWWMYALAIPACVFSSWLAVRKEDGDEA